MRILTEALYKAAVTHGIVTRARFQAASRETEHRQRKMLRKHLWRNRHTAFGREHDFAALARDPGAYRQAVPIRDYEGHRPWIDRVVAGEEDVLFRAREHLQMFARTSGTTARPKLIPITRRWMACYRRTSLVWGMFLVRDHPGIFAGKILQITGSVVEGHTDRGVPIGAASGVHATTQKRVVQTFYVLPACVFDITSYEARYYAAARLSLAENLSLLATANPSTVLRLVRLIDSRSEDLIRDIRDGTLDPGLDMPAPIRSELEAGLRPDPDAARRLEQARAAGQGTLRPFDYWPDLQLLAHWQGGPLASYLAEYPTWFREETPIRDIGLLASEARMTVPIEDGTPAGLLDVQSLYFEFIPLEEAETAEPRTCLAHEVEAGRDYLLVFTSCAGLYRYDIADVVRVNGFVGTNPLITFLHKGRHICSVTGEKLSEHQVVEAARSVGRKLGGQPGDFTVYPEHPAGQSPRYVLAMEDLAGLDAVGWQAAYEGALCSQNLEYREKRASGRLAPVRIQLVSPGTFQRVQEARLAGGGSVEQYKHVYLAQEPPDALLEAPGDVAGKQAGQAPPTP